MAANVRPNKRAAEDEGLRELKRLRRVAAEIPLQHTAPDDDSDLESEYLSQTTSVSGEATDALTPFTLQSPTGSHKHPSDLKTLRCPHDGCDKAFNRPSRLKDHLRSHTNDRVYKCLHEGCDKDFLRDSHLNHHVKSAHTDIRDYACEWEGCGKKFVTATRLRRHEAAHEGREKYRCLEFPPCSETFRKHTTLQRHIISAHLGQKPFPCTHMDPSTGEQCSEGFESAGRLRAHEARQHSGARFACTECQGDGDDETVLFQSYAELQTHNRVAHPPKCPECDKICSSCRDLRRHIELTHEDLDPLEQRLHLCTHPGCGRRFTKKGNLKVHFRTVHDGERRFICGETDVSTSKKVEGWTGEGACGNRFSAKLSLEEHIRTAHMGMMNSRLERQPKNQRKETTRKSHEERLLASLTGAGYGDQTGRNITCLVDGCEYMFFRNYDLDLHLKSRHGISDRYEDQVFERDYIEGSIMWADSDMAMDIDIAGNGTGHHRHAEYGEMLVDNTQDDTRVEMEVEPIFCNMDGEVALDPLLR